MVDFQENDFHSSFFSLIFLVQEESAVTNPAVDSVINQLLIAGFNQLLIAGSISC